MMTDLDLSPEFQFSVHLIQTLFKTTDVQEPVSKSLSKNPGGILAKEK